MPTSIMAPVPSVFSRVTLRLCSSVSSLAFRIASFPSFQPTTSASDENASAPSSARTRFPGDAALVDSVLAYDAYDDPRTDDAEKIVKRMGVEVAARWERRLRRFVKFGDEEGQRRDLLDVVPSLTIGNAA